MSMQLDGSVYGCCIKPGEVDECVRRLVMLLAVPEAAKM